MLRQEEVRESPKLLTRLTLALPHVAQRAVGQVQGAGDVGLGRTALFPQHARERVGAEALDHGLAEQDRLVCRGDQRDAIAGDE